jgi:hypothetical protein
MPDFYETIESRSFEDYWDALMDSAWLTDWSRAKRAELGKRLEPHFGEKRTQDPFSVYRHLRTGEVNDMRAGHLAIEEEDRAELYLDLLDALQDASLGRFLPEEYEQELVAEKSVHRGVFRSDEAHGSQLSAVSFCLGTRCYGGVFTAAALDAQFLDFVNLALRDGKEQRAFVLLPDVAAVPKAHSAKVKRSRQDYGFDASLPELHLAFVEPETYRAAVESGLLPAEDPPRWPSGELPEASIVPR